MSFLFNTTGGVSGFDQYGHMLRAVLEITTCNFLVTHLQTGCEANWGSQTTAGAASDRSLAALQAIHPGARTR